MLILFSFNLAPFWQPCPLHLLFFPRGRVRGYIISGRCLVEPFFFVFGIHTTRKTKWWLLQWEAARTVCDELIISEMSVVMKIGHLQEATQFIVTEVFTFLVTLGSSQLYTRWERTRQDYMLRKIIPASFRVPILLGGGRNALGCRRKRKQTTFMKHTCTCTHLRKGGPAALPQM